MKKGIMMFCGKAILPMTFAALLITGCHVNDTNPATTPGIGGGDSAVLNADTMMTDNTRVAPSDTASSAAMMNKDTAAKMSTDTSSKGKMTDKKGRKGKVSIVAPDAKANTAAMEMDKEGFYANTEVLPAFPGGQKALERFFEDNIVYPVPASDNGTEGTVKLTFAVDENGKVYNPVVMGAPLGDGLEDEAKRVFKKMPTWTPGRIKGKNVKTRYTLPIRFQLDQ